MTEEIQFEHMVERVKNALAGAGANTGNEMLPVETVEEIIQTTISGNVTDSNGNPLPGASVIEVGTTNGTTTDFDGNFNLDLENENATLEVSFIGFTTQRVDAISNADLNVVLVLDIAGLDEVVLTGYGSQNKRDITSAISVLDLDGTAEKSNTDVGQLIQSRSAGVRVVQNNGRPGASPQIFVRGISSLSGNITFFIFLSNIDLYLLVLCCSNFATGATPSNAIYVLSRGETNLIYSRNFK